MFSEICCAAIDGIEALIVHVEVDVSDGLPMFNMIGYLASEVKEAKDRVRTAIKNSDYRLPVKHVTVNLAPADIRKAGTAFDLPIAIAVLAATGIIPNENIAGIMVAGELGLDGRVIGVNGILPIICEAREKGFSRCIVPKDNLAEAIVIGGIRIFAAETLTEATEYLNGAYSDREYYFDYDICPDEENTTWTGADFNEISGQAAAKRAVMVATAGRHNILMSGPPGAGKTMLAQRIPGIMPPMSYKEKLEVAKIYSIAGKLDNSNILTARRPFRSPHHTITGTALAGGGRIPVPGEISLANNGVLFLDELPEFTRNAIEILRQPLEERKVNVSRLAANYIFPADFMLVAAMNPCPCGYFPDRNKCKCQQHEIKRYLNKLSRPILDRIDIHVSIPAVRFEDIEHRNIGETSAEIRKKVEAAVLIQKERFKNREIDFNSQMSSEDVKKYCVLEKAEKLILREAYKALELTVRGCHRILRVARTIADIDESDRITEEHLYEAIGYRREIQNG